MPLDLTRVVHEGSLSKSWPKNSGGGGCSSSFITGVLKKQ
jgi:hypothetical protein